MTSHPPYGRARWATAGPASNLVSVALAALRNVVGPVDSSNAWPYLNLGSIAATPSEAVGPVRGGLGLLFAL